MSMICPSLASSENTHTLSEHHDDNGEVRCNDEEANYGRSELDRSIGKDSSKE